MAGPAFFCRSLRLGRAVAGERSSCWWFME